MALTFDTWGRCEAYIIQVYLQDSRSGISIFPNLACFDYQEIQGYSFLNTRVHIARVALQGFTTYMRFVNH